MAERAEDDRRRRDSRVPMLGLITVANVLTVLGGVYYMGSWTSTVSSEQRHTTEALTALQAVVYTKGEAMRDQRIVDVQMGDLARRVNMLEERKAPR